MSKGVNIVKRCKVRGIKSAVKQNLLPCDSFIIPKIVLSYTNHIPPKDRQVINGVCDAYHLLQKTWDNNTIELQEQFRVMLLNRSNHVLGIYDLSIGGVTGTIADPRLLFAAALMANASVLITSHNHPSGSVKPSEADKVITRRIKEGALLFDMVLLDHLIITPYSYYSFAEEGLI